MDSGQQKGEEEKSAAIEDSADDLDAMEAFCQGVELDEISFESWCDQHESLDLCYTLQLTKQQALAGCTQKITLTKKILPIKNDGPIEKIKRSHQVEIPPNTSNLDQIVISNGGDQKGELRGDLIVIARVT